MKKYIILSILISAGLIGLITYFGSFNMFVGDDFGYSFSDNIFSTLIGTYRNTHGGGYFGYFLCQFFCFFLPLLLKIHPADFICSIPHGIIKGILCCSTLLIISGFINLFNRIPKSNTDLQSQDERQHQLNYFLTYIFIIIYFLFSVISSQSLIFETNYNFYRYLLSLLFFGIFLSYIFKNILKKDTKSNISPEADVNTSAQSEPSCLKYPLKFLALIIACICGFITGTSSEILFYTTASIIGLIIIYNIIIHIIFKNKADILNSLKFNLNIYFYIPVCFLYSAIYMFTNNSGYKVIAGTRGMDNINITIQNIKEFSYYFFKLYFRNEIFYWIAFLIITYFGIYLAYKNKEIKNIILPIIINLSLLTVIYSLILCGKTNNEMVIGVIPQCRYFLSHNNIYFIYKMIAIIPIIIMLGYIIKSYPKTKYFIIMLIVITFFGCLKDINISKYKGLSFVHKDAKKHMYIAEKILRYEYLKNEIPYLPSNDDYRNYDLGYFYGLTEKEQCTKNELIVTQYYPIIYKDERSKKIGFCISESAYDKYIKMGGKFSDEELENIKFTRLLNDNFVLGEK